MIKINYLIGTDNSFERLYGFDFEDPFPSQLTRTIGNS